jgi:hypothetical protein
VQQAIASDPQFKELREYSEEIGLFMRDGYDLKTAVKIAERMDQRAKAKYGGGKRAPNVHDIKPRPAAATPDGESTSKAPTRKEKLASVDKYIDAFVDNTM